MFFKKNKINKNTVERYIWVARMPSIHGGKLPSTTPKPKVVSSELLGKGHYLFFKHCESQNSKHLIVGLMNEFDPVPIKRNAVDLHRCLWLYTSPRRFKRMGWDEFLSRSDTLDRSKNIALGLKGLWDINHPDFLQAIHWYSSIRGNLEKIIARRLPVSMCNDEKWSKSKQQSLFDDNVQPLYHPNGVYNSILNDCIPLPLRQLIQDTWFVIQQLAFNATSLKNLEKANSHMRSIYRMMIVSNFKVEKTNKVTSVSQALEGEFISSSQSTVFHRDIETIDRVSSPINTEPTQVLRLNKIDFFV